jgi:alpha-galactosidase
MGWNSWDCYGTSVTESEVLQNARFMAENLLSFGWNTVVIDIQWYEPTARPGGYNDNAPMEIDQYGRPVPAVNRFPSAAAGTGFTALAKEIHSLGLKFGLHILRGIPRRAVALRLPIFGTNFAFTAADVADTSSTCDWNSDNFGLDHSHPAAQAYYDSLLSLFAEWGVDYVKVDDMVGPFHEAEIASFAIAARTADPDMVISLSPGRQLSTEHAAHLREHSDVWRISADLWDNWSDVLGQFDRLAMWAPHAGQGKWPDADMLPLGRIGIREETGPDRSSRLTPDEARTMMTLWVIARSPLMFGGDLPSSDSDTIALLTNEKVFELIRTVTSSREIIREGGLVVWTAETGDRLRRYVAIFATGEESFDIDLPLTSLGSSPESVVVDLWERTELPRGSSLTGRVPAHGCLLVAIEPSATIR